MSVVPFPVSYAAEKLLVQAKEAAHEPTLFTITFGPGSIEHLDRDVLRTLAAITSMFGIPVELPEQPAYVERAIRLMLFTDRGSAGMLLTPELLNDQALGNVDHP